MRGDGTPGATGMTRQDGPATPATRQPHRLQQVNIKQQPSPPSPLTSFSFFTSLAAAAAAFSRSAAASAAACSASRLCRSRSSAANTRRRHMFSGNLQLDHWSGRKATCCLCCLLRAEPAQSCLCKAANQSMPASVSSQQHPVAAIQPHPQYPFPAASTPPAGGTWPPPPPPRRAPTAAATP